MRLELTSGSLGTSGLVVATKPGWQADKKTSKTSPVGLVTILINTAKNSMLLEETSLLEEIKKCCYSCVYLQQKPIRLFRPH